MTAAVLLTALLAAPPIATPAPTPPPLTAESIVSDYLAARGGLEKIRSIRSLRQTGHASTDGGREAVVVRELQRPDKSRFEFTVQGVTAVYVASGGSGWQVAPFDGQFASSPMPADAVADATEQADIEGPLVDWRAKGHRLALVGMERVGDRDAYRLELTLKGGVIRYDYIDVENSHHLRTETTRLVNGRPVRIEATFGSHRMQGGVLFPTTVEVVAKGRPQHLRIVVDRIEVNPTLAPSRFEMSAPKPVSP